VQQSTLNTTHALFDVQEEGIPPSSSLLLISSAPVNTKHTLLAV